MEITHTKIRKKNQGNNRSSGQVFWERRKDGIQTLDHRKNVKPTESQRAKRNGNEDEYRILRNREIKKVNKNDLKVNAKREIRIKQKEVLREIFSIIEYNKKLERRIR